MLLALRRSRLAAEITDDVAVMKQCCQHVLVRHADNDALADASRTCAMNGTWPLMTPNRRNETE